MTFIHCFHFFIFFQIKKQVISKSENIGTLNYNFLKLYFNKIESLSSYKFEYNDQAHVYTLDSIQFADVFRNLNFV